MEDRGVLKVGVQPESDAKQLADTFHVRLRGTVDLRHVVVRHPQFQRCSSNESSLKAIGAKLFGIKFPLEHMRFRLSNWNALELERR